MVGTLVRGCRCRCATPWSDLELTFELAVVTLTIKSCPVYISETVRCRKLILGRDIGWGCRCAMSWCDLDLTVDLAVVTLTYKILSELYLGYHKI